MHRLSCLEWQQVQSVEMDTIERLQICSLAVVQLRVNSPVQSELKKVILNSIKNTQVADPMLAQCWVSVVVVSSFTKLPQH